MCDDTTNTSMQMECDFASDNDLSLFEDEGDLNDGSFADFSKLDGPIEPKSSFVPSSQNTNVSNLTFMSKSVFTLVSNIFKCPVSEETLKNNISLSAPKIPFLNIRPCDPWLKNFNPGLVPESLESEILTQRFVSNFLRVAFPLINLLDTMSKGRLTQAKVETSITDALLLLSSSLENVNNWRRENLVRRYNLQHLKLPDVSPSENAFLFPSSFEKSAKYPSHEDIYQTNVTLPDLEINSVAKFSNEVLSGPTFLDGIENKVQKMISQDRQNRGLKDVFTQTDGSQERSKILCSVGSQVQTCNSSSALGSSASAAAASLLATDKTTLISSQPQPSANLSSPLKNEGVSSTSIRKTTIVSEVSASGAGGNSDRRVPMGAINGKGGQVNSTNIITIADSSNNVSATTASKTHQPAAASDNVNKVAQIAAAAVTCQGVSNVDNAAGSSALFQKTFSNTTAATSTNDDVIEVLPSPSTGVQVFESGICIEDDEEETSPVTSSSRNNDVTDAPGEPVTKQTDEPEVVLLELSDVEKPITLAATGNKASSGNLGGAQVTKPTPSAQAVQGAEVVSGHPVKKKYVPITGPSPPHQSKPSNANSSQSSSSQITVNNSKKRPIRSMPSIRQVPEQSLSDITSSSGATSNQVMSKNRTLGAAAMDDSPLTRTVSQQHRLVTAAGGPGPRNPAVFQHAAAVAGFGMPLSAGQLNPAAVAASARVVRALADPYPNTVQQQLEHEAAKRSRYSGGGGFGGSYSGGGGGMPARSQQDMWRGANHGGATPNRRGGGGAAHRGGGF